MIYQSLLGALLADVLGVPHEGKRAEHIPQPALISLTPSPGYARSHPAAAAGAWSDDGAQMLCLAEVLLGGDGQLDL